MWFRTMFPDGQEAWGRTQRCPTNETRGEDAVSLLITDIECAPDGRAPPDQAGEGQLPLPADSLIIFSSLISGERCVLKRGRQLARTRLSKPEIGHGKGCDGPPRAAQKTGGYS